MAAATDTILRALVDDADEATLRVLAERLRPWLAPVSTEPDRWLTADEAAAYLGCGVGRVYALRSAKRIPYERDGSRLLFRRSSLDAWIARGGGIRP